MSNGSDQMHAYTEAVTSGLYAKRSGLVGKYDNVRRYWEDEITGNFLRPHLAKLIRRARERMQRIRIMDLGCGSADGFELLSNIRPHNPDLRSVEVALLTPDILGLYKGLDLNEDLLNQAADIYGNSPKMRFEQADFTEGLPLMDDEPPYDLYFSSYGTFSHHNEDETAIRLIAQIAERVEDYAVIVCDWLGRYSYEWQSLWTNDLSENRNMDYVISYIYSKEERLERWDELQRLYLRLMSRQEAEAIIEEASKRSGVKIAPLRFFDRSIFTGRHIDTGDYNPYAQPIRQAVNSLHEANVRTEMKSLLIDYVPKEGFDFVNNYFDHLQMCWNTLIEYTNQLMISYDDAASRLPDDAMPDIPASYPKALREAMDKVRRVVKGVGWLDSGLPRENIIEPQLGYALRDLVCGLQQGMGCAHGLCAVLEVDKTSQ